MQLFSFIPSTQKNKHKTPKVKKHKFAFRRTSFLARVDAKFSGIHKQTRVLHIPLTLFWLHLITRLALPKENAREESNARSTYGFLTLINSFTQNCQGQQPAILSCRCVGWCCINRNRKVNVCPLATRAYNNCH